MRAIVRNDAQHLNAKERRTIGGTVYGTPRALLRLENLAIIVAAISWYIWLQASWWLFAIVFLVPDASVIGYLRGPRLGAAIYNAGHWYGLPALLIAVGLPLHNDIVVAAALIWIAHIAVDRTFGFGLKYAESFEITHLGKALGA